MLQFITFMQRSSAVMQHGSTMHQLPQAAFARDGPQAGSELLRETAPSLPCRVFATPMAVQGTTPSQAGIRLPSSKG
jgi:hypothetical protein